MRCYVCERTSFSSAPLRQAISIRQSEIKQKQIQIDMLLGEPIV
jgi:hypothetical protein